MYSLITNAPTNGSFSGARENVWPGARFHDINVRSMRDTRWLYNYNSTSIRRPFDCLSKIIKVTVSHGWQPGSNTGWLGESPTT